MLYVFAGFPKNRLHAGGLQCCIESDENLAELEHDPQVQYRKEGVFLPFDPNSPDEMLYPIEYRMSDLCLRDGITWDWFPENWSFGNGVTVHKTSASPEYKTVVHGTNLDLNEFLTLHGSTRLAEIELERTHVRHESWKEYESRWLPGTCPRDAHVVHLTWMVTTHRLPEFAYNRIRDLIENGNGPQHPEMYEVAEEPGKYLSEIRVWDGKPSTGGQYALPGL